MLNVVAIAKNCAYKINCSQLRNAARGNSKMRIQGPTEAVREILRRDPHMPTTKIIAELSEYNPSTIRTQVSRQRQGIFDEIEQAAVPPALQHKVAAFEFDLGPDVSVLGRVTIPDMPYFMIILESPKSKDARVIRGNGGSARQRINKLRDTSTQASMADIKDNAWIREQGGAVGLILFP